MSSELTEKPKFCQSERWMEKLTVTVPPAPSVPDEPAVMTQPSELKFPVVPLTSEYCPDEDVIPA